MDTRTDAHGNTYVRAEPNSPDLDAFLAACARRYILAICLAEPKPPADDSATPEHRPAD